MAIGHIRHHRRFKPSGIGGGSRKGKPQGRWPLILIVVASAIYDRAAGSLDARLEDRSSPLSAVAFGQQMDQYVPGWRGVAATELPGRKTPYVQLLKNRDYKRNIYSGTSDRGPRHDPRTRAAVPGESWRRSVPVGSSLMNIYEAIVASRITVVKDWRRFLDPTSPSLFS